MTEYITLEQAATAFAIQTVFSTSDCLDMLQNAIQKGWISPSDGGPVRRGRWGFDGVYVVCSVCNRLTLSPIVKQLPTFKYCPNCGAIMEDGL